MTETTSQMPRRIFMSLVLGLAGLYLGYHTLQDLQAFVATGCIPYQAYDGCHPGHIAATLSIEGLTMFFFGVIIYQTLKR